MEISPEFQAISNASDSELMLICTAAAERGAAFCRALGPSEYLTWVDTSLGLAWAAAAGESVQDECAEALDELEMEPHDGEDDSSHPEFYVTQAVGLVGNALAVSLRPSVAKVEVSINAIRSLLSMVDFKFAGERPVILRYGEVPPPPGLLVQMEIDAEREVLAILAQAKGDFAQGETIHPLATQVQASASAFAVRLASSVEEFAELSNWEF
jgi:hypothetical protein